LRGSDRIPKVPSRVTKMSFPTLRMDGIAFNRANFVESRAGYGLQSFKDSTATDIESHFQNDKSP